MSFLSYAVLKAVFLHSVPSVNDPLLLMQKKEKVFKFSFLQKKKSFNR